MLYKIMVTVLLILVNLQASNLTELQSKKLNSPLVKIKSGLFVIEEYNQINFDKTIFFDGESLDKVIVKTKATMKKGTVHKEQFIAISSTLSDQIMQSIFMNPQYFPHIKSIDLLTKKPSKVNLTIKIDFKKDGLDTVVTNGRREQKRFISYEEMFHKRLK